MRSIERESSGGAKGSEPDGGSGGGVGLVNAQNKFDMNKINVFLSSKVKPVFKGLNETDYDLGRLRQFIKSKLEAETFFDEKIIKVIINEETFEQDFTKDAFDACLSKVEKSDVIVVLYNGDAGWAPDKDKNANGICHE